MPNTKLRDWRIAKWAQNAVYSAISQAKILTGYAPNVVIPSAEHNELFNQASVAIAELQTAGTLLYNDQLAMGKGAIFAVVESGEVKLRQCIADQAAGFNPSPEQNSNVLPFPNPLSAAEVSASAQVDSNVFPAVNGATVQAQIQQLVQRTAFLRNTAGRNLPVGALMFTAAEAADQGWLALTESTQLVSVTQYPEAFAKLGTRFGGNGTTTFGLPTIAEGRALLFNGASTSGTVTTGEVKAHTHTISGPLYVENGSVANHIAEGSGNPTTTFSFETTSTGGSANLAAGVKFLLCIKMFDVLSANHYEPAEGGNYIWPEKVVSLGSVSGDVELDFSAGTVFEMTVTDDVIFTAENVPVPGLTYEFGLRIVNGGAHSITWPDGWSVEGTLSADGISVVQGYIQSTSCTAWVMYAASSSSVAALIADLANNTDPAKGAGMVGFSGATQYEKNQDFYSAVNAQLPTDGVTDATSALNAAATYCRANKRKLWLRGTYQVSGTLDFSGIEVEGEGEESTILQASSAQFNVIKTTGNSSLKGFTIQGGWDGSTAGQSGEGIHFDDSAGLPYNVRLSDLSIQFCKRNGLNIRRTAYSSIHNVKVNACGLHAQSLYAVDGSDATTTVYYSGRNVFSDTPNGFGTRLENCININLTGISEYTKGVEIAGNDNRNINLIGYHQEHTAGSKFVTYTGSVIGHVILGCYGNGFSLPYSASVFKAFIRSNVGFDDPGMGDNGNVYIADGGEARVTAAGTVTAALVTLPAGTYSIDCALQTANTGSATMSGLWARLTTDFSADANVSATNDNFVFDSTGGPSLPIDSRVTFSRRITLTTEQGVYLRAYIGRTAGEVAYRGVFKATRVG